MIRLTLKDDKSILVNPDLSEVVLDKTVSAMDIAGNCCRSQVQINNGNFWEVCESKEQIRNMIEAWNNATYGPTPQCETPILRWWQKPLMFIDMMWYVFFGFCGALVARHFS